MSVKNIAEEAQTFDDTSQYAFDASKKKFSADSEVDLDINSDAWMAEINPGNQLTGTLAYDIPTGDKIVKMELHDSCSPAGSPSTSADRSGQRRLRDVRCGPGRPGQGWP